MRKGGPIRRRRGFTIVELVVASLVGVLVATGTAAAISQMYRARNHSRAHQQAFQRADTAAARIALDLTTALRRSDPLQQCVRIMNGGGPGSERDELLVLMTSMRPLRGADGEAEGQEYEVQYRVEPGIDGREALWRRMDIGMDDYIDGGGIATPIAGGVTALSFLATDQSGEWIEQWDSDADGLPHAVKITVTALADDGRASATGVRIVALDRVPLPPVVEGEGEESSEGESGASTGGSSGSSGGGR
ncbi:MAG TPA: prepilin-type N-terminal cleavage/methylation domain-containing protein [Phycisphaerales bacterium]|nr:prepilin-type N-terminal cleavage/methylation domain-containing protein [Phycisphaerales bacterium]